MLGKVEDVLTELSNNAWVVQVVEPNPAIGPKPLHDPLAEEGSSDEGEGVESQAHGTDDGGEIKLPREGVAAIDLKGRGSVAKDKGIGAGGGIGVGVSGEQLLLP